MKPETTFSLAIDGNTDDRPLHLLQRYLRECKIKSHAHSLSSSRNRVQARRANWLCALFPAFAGILSVGAFSDLDACGNLTNEILVGFTVGLSFLSTLCTVTSTVFKYNEKEAQHHNSSGHFGEIASDIELYLAKRTRLNGSLKPFLETIHELILVRESNAPPLSEPDLQTARETHVPPTSGRSSVTHKLSILESAVS